MHYLFPSFLITVSLFLQALAAPPWRRDAGFVARHHRRHFRAFLRREDYSTFNFNQTLSSKSSVASSAPQTISLAGSAAPVSPKDLTAQAYDMPHKKRTNLACPALLDLYTGMGGPGWTHQTGWAKASSISSRPEDMNCCEWYGVTCSADGNKVLALELSGNRVRGPISNAIYSLPDLQTLNLSSNLLYSTIPPLPMTFKVLDLSHSFVYGSLSPSLFQSSSLSIVHLTNNTIDGPVDIRGAENLDTLFLDSNYFSKIITGPSHGRKWKRLVLRNNMFSGPLPDLSGAVDLEMVEFGNNKFTGNMFDPTALTNLVYFDLRANELSGPLPLLSSFKSPALKLLGLAANKFTGPPVLRSATHDHPLLEAPPTLRTCSITVQNQYIDLGCDNVPSFGANSTWAAKCGVIRECQKMASKSV